MDWINEARDCDKGWGPVNTEMKLKSHIKCGKFD